MSVFTGAVHSVPMTGPSPVGRGRVLGGTELFLGLWQGLHLANQLPGFRPLLPKILTLVSGWAEAPVSDVDSRAPTKTCLSMNVGAGSTCEERLIRPSCWHHPRTFYFTRWFLDAFVIPDPLIRLHSEFVWDVFPLKTEPSRRLILKVSF